MIPIGHIHRTHEDEAVIIKRRKKNGDDSHLYYTPVGHYFITAISGFAIHYEWQYYPFQPDPNLNSNNSIVYSDSMCYP